MSIWELLASGTCFLLSYVVWMHADGPLNVILSLLLMGGGAVLWAVGLIALAAR